MVCYCKKCGRIGYTMFDTDKRICDCCKSEVYPIPKEFLATEWTIKKELRQQFIDVYIKTAPEFDENLFNQRDAILAQKNFEYDTKMEIGKSILEEQSRTVKCTYCGSTNVKKISATSRVVSTGIFDIASKKIGKQWHCNQCGADF